MKKMGAQKNRTAFFLAGILIASLMLGLWNVINSTQQVSAEENRSSGAVDNAETSESEVITEEGPFERILDLPEDLRAFYLRPQQDFYTDEEATAEEIGKQIDEILTASQEYGFNSVIVDTAFNDMVIYTSTELNTTLVDALQIVIEKAHAKDMPVYAVYHLYGVSDKTGQVVSSELCDDTMHFVSSNAFTLASEYNLDGILLDSYAVEDSGENYSLYMKRGNGMPYKEWLRDTESYVMKVVSNEIKMSKNTMAVGLLAEAVWANKNTIETGSETASAQEAYNRGADTKWYIDNDYVDFVLVKAFGSLTDPEEPFEQVVSWWSGVAQKNEKPLYILHSVDNIISDKPGWTGYDQLARQLMKAMQAAAYQGSAYSGYSTFMANPNDSITSLMKVYENQYKESDLFKNVTITSPKEITSSTYETVVKFEGKFDPNFDVLINGEKVIPTSEGEFSQWYDLKVGKNTFVVEHKGEKIPYTVTRKVQIIKSVYPTGSVSVYGNSSLFIQAEAYVGTSVSATINGKTIKLTEAAHVNDSSDSKDSSYVTYEGVYTVPSAGKSSKNIGSIVVKGSHSGLSETKKGASVTILSGSYSGGSNNPGYTGAGNGSLEVTNPGDQIQVTSSFADVYPVGTYQYVSPQDLPLPQGTIDYVTARVNLDGQAYYILNSGKRVKQSDCKAIGGSNRGGNTISNMRVSVEGNTTYLRVDSAWNAPVTMAIPEVGYESRPYWLSGTFNAGYVELIFDYATAVSNVGASISSSPLFSGSEWIKDSRNGIPIYRLRLNLSKKGIFTGVDVKYDGKTLVFSFNHDKNSLSGLRVYLDPGHGGSDPGATRIWGGVSYIEKTLNRQVASHVKTILESKGATVYMPDAGDQYVSVENRRKQAKSWNPDVFISLHHNSSSSSSVKGIEVYYNAAYGQPLAAAIAGQMGGGANATRFGNYVVTREKKFPSVLVEVGYISNQDEAQRISKATYQKQVAEQIVNGIADYIRK